MPISSASGFNLKQILSPVAEDIARIDDVMRSLVGIKHPLLQHAVEAIITSGGKRLRPAVLFLCAKFHDYDLDKLLPMSAAIQLLHTATLVHDDTIDQALTRRGLPTLNSLVDNSTAVLVGDYIFAKSAVLSTMGGVPRATRIFAEALVTIVEGELEQKLATRRVVNSFDDYNRRIYSKTAALFAAAGELGGVLSGAPEESIQQLRHYGRQIGMAFQIIDDALDMQSTSDKLGKPAGGDLRQGTVTLPTVFYLQDADQGGRSLVSQVIAGKDCSEELLAQAIGLITSSEAIRQTYAVAQRFVNEAKATLGRFPDTGARRSLAELADFVVQRDF